MNPKILSFIKRPVLRQFGGGLTSQVMQSAANFTLSMIVARSCSKAEYGLYTVAFTTMIIIASFQNALFNAPFQVIAPSKNEKDRVLFTSGIAQNQFIFFIGLSVLALLGFVGYGIVKNSMTYLAFFLSLLIASCAWVAREFVRTLNSSHLNMKALLTGEIAYAGIAMTGTLLLWYFKIINCPFALLCLATACIIGSAVGLFQSKQQFLLGLSYSKSALKETSKYSKWAVVGVTISIIQSHSYVYLLSAMTSLAVTAEVSASKMFLMPIGILISGIGRIFIPKGSEILNKSGGYNRLLKLILVTIIALVLLSISYCIILYIFFKEIVHITIGNKYLNINQYFLLWASFFTIQVIRYPISSALQVLKKFKYTAIVGAVSATVTITICLLGIRTMSGKEVILGLLCGEIVGILLYLPVLKYKTTDTL